MKISEEQLKQLVLRILKELSQEEKNGKSQKRYMVCGDTWDERYGSFLREMELSEELNIYSVIPDAWKENGQEAVLRSFRSCDEVTYRSQGIPVDLITAATIFPVVSRDVAVKTALCISDTFETLWTSACLEAGSRIVFLQSGLQRFSGREQPAYINQILSYYRKVLEYGVEICSVKEIWNINEREAGQQELSLPHPGKKRVITASNVEQYATNGVLILQPGDIVTDMAKDRAKFLNIVFQ